MKLFDCYPGLRVTFLRVNDLKYPATVRRVFPESGTVKIEFLTYGEVHTLELSPSELTRAVGPNVLDKVVEEPAKESSVPLEKPRKIKFDSIRVGDLVELHQTVGERSVVIRDRVTKATPHGLVGTGSLAICGNIDTQTNFSLIGTTEKLKVKLFLIDRKVKLPTEVGSVVSVSGDNNFVAVLVNTNNNNSSGSLCWRVTSLNGSSYYVFNNYLENLNWTVIREGQETKK